MTNFLRLLPALTTGVVLLGVMLGSTAPAAAQSPLTDAIQSFDEGNRRYQAGDYRGALSAYEAVLAAGYASGPLYFNMGNAYYRLDEIGQAIRHYERARRLMPERPELIHNLQIARSRTRDQISRLPTPVWTQWWHTLVGTVGARGLFTLGLLCYLVAMGLLGHRVWTGTRTPWHRRGLAASLFVGLILLTMAFGASLDRSAFRQAVVTADAVALRLNPSPDAASEMDIHEGIVLDVLEEQDGWVEVRLPNGITGWLEPDTIAEI